MEYETKALIATIAQLVKNAKTIDEAYGYIVEIAKNEGFDLENFNNEKNKYADKKNVFKELQELFDSDDRIK